jgi:hypothetical protein
MMSDMEDAERAWIVNRWITGITQREVGDEVGLTNYQVCTAIKRFCDDWSGINVHASMLYDNERRKVALKALQNYFMRSDDPGLKRPVLPGEKTWWDDYHSLCIFFDARLEHAWLLRAEGKTLKDVGNRLGVSREQARQMILKFGRKVGRAMRRVRWPGAYDVWGRGKEN